MDGKTDKITPLPCPFCGSIPEPRRMKGARLDGFELAIIICSGPCAVKPKVGSTMATGKAIDAVIKRWNTRSN